jgi:hypothetical protein
MSVWFLSESKLPSPSPYGAPHADTTVIGHPRPLTSVAFPRGRLAGQQQTPEPQPQLDDETSIGRGSSGITGSSRAGATSGFVARMIAA